MLPLSEALEFATRAHPTRIGCFTKKERTRSDTQPTVDHVVPLRSGGSNKLKNYVICCNKCNSKKGHSEATSMRLSDELKAKWFYTIDQHILSHNGTPYPDPY